ncbi:MAG: hypothetical protein VB126_01095 [Paludibacter sp.]|nr:hypothetical protein [Paludibacter sp.]
MTLKLRQSEFNDTLWVERHPQSKRSTKFEFGPYFGVDVTQHNFNDFESALNSYNTELLNRTNTPLLWGIAGNLKHYTLGLQFGTLNQVESNHDSLKIKLNKTIYGINFGYNLIDNKRWVISPLVSFKWYRYRLLNSSINYEIPLTDYLQNRDLDIRINQAICVTGINIAYKSYKYSILPCDFWTVGLQGGYPIKLHDKPLVFSKQNRLTSDYKIESGKYYLSFYFSFNFQTW